MHCICKIERVCEITLYKLISYEIKVKKKTTNHIGEVGKATVYIYRMECGKCVTRLTLDVEKEFQTKVGPGTFMLVIDSSSFSSSLEECNLASFENYQAEFTNDSCLSLSL